jgi:hypothetical protein
MSKEQINYLLVLATLLVIWLFFNTFYTSHAKRNYGAPSSGGMMFARDRRPPNPMATPNIPQPPNMAEFFKSQTRGGQTPAVPQGMSPVSSQTEKTAKS